MKKVTVAWTVLAYQKPELVFCIVDHILQNTQEDSIFLHYDKNSSSEEFESFRNRYRGHPRVFYYQKYQTPWGGYGAILAEHFLSEEIIRLKVPYDYVVLLSGQSFFVKPLSQFKEFLQKIYGKTVFCGENPLPLFVSENEYETKVKRTSHRLFPYWAKNYQYINPDLNFHDIYRLITHFSLYWNETPIQESKIKTKFINFMTKIFIRIFGFIPMPFGIPARMGGGGGVTPWPHNIYRASPHKIIFKEAHEKAMSFSDKKLWMDILKKAHAPDELFFPTLIYEVTNESERHLANCGLFGGWWWDVSEDELEQTIEQPERFFARKFTDVSMVKKLSARISDKI